MSVAVVLVLVVLVDGPSGVRSDGSEPPPTLRAPHRHNVALAKPDGTVVGS